VTLTILLDFFITSVLALNSKQIPASQLTDVQFDIDVGKQQASCPTDPHYSHINSSDRHRSQEVTPFAKVGGHVEPNPLRGDITARFLVGIDIIIIVKNFTVYNGL